MGDFQKRLRQAMLLKHIRQKDIAERTGISDGKISSYVNGRYKPNAEALVRIAAALDVSPAWLTGEGEDLILDEFPPAQIEDPVKFQVVPVVGRVAAGEPIFAIENQIDSIMIQDNRTGLFGLRVVGDSMSPRIMDGDLVLVHQQDTAKDGDIIVALIEEEATCKVIKKSAWGVTLVPFNTSYAPFVFTEAEADERLHIIGKVIGSYHSWE